MHGAGHHDKPVGGQPERDKRGRRRDRCNTAARCPGPAVSPAAQARGGPDPAALTPSTLAALSTVEQAGPLRLGDLAAAEGIAPSTLTRLVAVLEELGDVRRDADPKDARASTLAITLLGHETLERLRAEN